MVAWKSFAEIIFNYLVEPMNPGRESNPMPGNEGIFPPGLYLSAALTPQINLLMIEVKVSVVQIPGKSGG